MPGTEHAFGDLTAVVVNWETPDYTIRCITALLGDGLPLSRIVIVDNGSQDGSALRIREALGDCRMIELRENVGYARAANTGARELPGRVYLQMNNDAFLHQAGSLSQLLSALDDPAVGIAVPRVRFTDLTLQQTVRPLDTPGASFVRASGLSRLVPNRWQPQLGRYFDQQTTRDIIATDSPVLLIRDRLWEQLPGFDERLSLGQESALCWRARDLGWRVRFVHTAEFLHVGSGSVATKWSRPQYAESFSRAEGMLLRTHLSPLPAHLSYAFIMAGHGSRYAVHRATGHADAAAWSSAQLRGYADGFRSARTASTGA